MYKRLFIGLTLGGVALALVISLLSLGVFSNHGGSAQANPLLVLGIDMDPSQAPANACTGPAASGETCTIGTVEQCIRVDAGSFDIDTFVTGLTNGFSGFNYGLSFPDTAVAGDDADLTMTGQTEVNAAVNLVMQANGSGPISLSDAVPDGISPHGSSVADFGTFEDATWTLGTLVRHTFSIGAGAVPGLYNIAFVPSSYAITDQFSATYTVDQVQNGVLAVGTDCPGSADLKKLDFYAIGLVDGDDLDESVEYPFQLQEVIHNNGPDAILAGAPAIDHKSIVVPAGIVISYHVTDGEEVHLNGDPLSVGPSDVVYAVAGDLLEVFYPILPPIDVSPTFTITTEWDVHCLEPSTHALHWDNEVLLPEFWTDPEPGNNALPLDLSVDCIAQADLKVLDQVVSAAPSAKSPLPYPTLITETPDTFEITKVVHNNGPYGPVLANIGGMVIGYVYTGSNDYGQCVTVGGWSQQDSLDVSPASLTKPETFSITCGRGGIEKDDDGDVMVDEDPVNLADDDADTVVDEDSAFYIVTPLIYNSIAPKDPHVIDYDLTNNEIIPGVHAAGTPISLAVIRPFTPSFSAVVEGCPTCNPDLQTVPASNNCVVGEPCKTLTSMSVPAGTTAEFPFGGGQPIGLVSPIIPEGPMIFSWADTNGVTNGEKVGKFDFAVYINPAPAVLDCQTPLSGSSDLYDAANPPAGYGPLAGLYVADSTVPGVDVPDAVTALAPPAAVTSWSSALDGVVLQVVASNPTAFLHAHYVGLADLGGGKYIPGNGLVFDMSGGFGVGPFLTFFVTGDPSAPPSPTDVHTCAPLSIDALLLGQTPNTAEVIKVCQVANDAGTPYHFALGSQVRTDIGETDFTPPVPFTCVAAENDASCDLVKDEFPVVGVWVDESETVEVTINNDAPDDVHVDLSLVSPAGCPAAWDPATVPAGGTVDPPIMVGANWISQAHWDELGMAASETRVRNVDYIVNCADGSYELQIIVNLTTSVTDPNPLDNQCENHPLVTASDDDVDDDTVVNWQDNCPFNPNPDQADNDGDGLGDVCDDDDDDDGIPDTSDLCPLDAEDIDGEDDADGCPDSDAHSIVVDKNHSYDVDVSVDHVETVTTTITNGNYGLYSPDGMLFIELLKSDVTNPDDNCQARWVCEPGDGCVEDTLWEDFDGDTVADELVLYSQLEVVIENVPPFNDVSKTRDYIVHCNARSDHQIFLEEAAVPALPVIDPNVQNGNVHKQYIDIQAFDNADVKELSYDVHDAPASLDAGVSDIVVLKKVLHNNGPAPVQNAIVTSVASGSEDCTITLIGGSPYAVALPVSTQVAIFEEWEITCSEPSGHHFEFENSVTVDELHLKDPDLGNNSGSTSIDLPVIASADVAVNDVFVEGLPADIDASEDYDVVLKAIVENLGPYTTVNVPVDIGATVPPDCTLTPSSGSVQVTAHVGTPVAATVNAVLHCASVSTHVIDTTATVGQPKEAHVVDQNDQNDSAANGQSVNVWRWVTKSIVDLDMGADPLLVVPSTVVDLPITETDDSSEPINALKTATLDQLAGPVTCLVDEDGGALTNNFATQADVPEVEIAGLNYHTLDWDLHMLAAAHVGEEAWCVLQYDVSKVGNEIHVGLLGEPITAHAELLVCADTDGDTVPDNCPPSGMVPDNCPEIPNADQADSDGDGLGDACDSDHDVTVKHCYKFGPAPANLSTEQGRYMWAICEIGNLTDHVEAVATELDVSGAPAGCSQDIELVLPAAETFNMSALEQKWVLYRVRYECHDPALPGVNLLDVAYCVDPNQVPFDDDGDTVVDEDGDDNTDNDGDTKVDEDPPEGDQPPVCHEQQRQLIVHQP